MLKKEETEKLIVPDQSQSNRTALAHSFLVSTQKHKANDYSAKGKACLQFSVSLFARYSWLTFF